MGHDEQLIARAQEWIAGDPDPSTRTELEGVIDSGDLDDLAERMSGTLSFGTAGLRGKVEAGSNRMNRAVVIRATAGLAAYLSATPGALVVVGRDARLSSLAFMEDVVGVLGAAGFRVRYFAEPVPTPIVAYTALDLDAASAVVVTASHNPPQDNGYKVYAANGAQIVPPADTEIAAAIGRVGPAAEVPRLPFTVDQPDSSGADVAALDDGVFARYLRDLAPVRGRSKGDADLHVVYTPLHGVGGEYVVEALHHFGYPGVAPVAEQMRPDGRFPTVAFPNPEEPGAMDLAIDQARRTGGHVIIANDPDTDRLAAVAPTADGDWRPFTGNQIGVLLADYLLSLNESPEPIVISSIVSSPMLRDIAAAAGATYARTLTGFKWIWNAALDLEEAGAGTFVFGYEEALGYSVAPIVRDKDGISAAVLFADLAAECRNSGMTMWERLAGLYRRHGLWVSTQVSVVRTGTEGAAEIAAAMRQLEHDQPVSLGGLPVTGVVDYRRNADQRPRYLGATPLVEFELGERGRALIRPSGTEPKMKVYVDLTAAAGDGDQRAAEQQLMDVALAVGADVAAFVGLGDLGDQVGSTGSGPGHGTAQ